MADHLDDIFSDDQMIEAPVEVAEVVEPVQEEEVVQPIAEPEAPVEQTEAAEPTPVQEAEARQVPLTVVLDERDRRKAAEAERDRYKQQWEETQKRPAANVPDPLDNPEGFAAYQDQRFQEALTVQKFQMSEMMAKQAHGDETVQKASEWALERANSDPTFAAAYHRQQHPIDWIVQQHKRDALISQLPTDVTSLDELVEREIARRSASVAAVAPAMAVPQQASPPVKVPRSLASQGESPSDIRQVATGPMAAVDSLFQ